MKLFDLTHSINPHMLVYPGDEPPVLKTANSIDKSGFKDKLITMGSHTGTHIDAPAHLDILPSNYFIFSCFPLNLEDADGSPVRAVAYLE